MTIKYIYTGPSWAYSSFPNTKTDKTTNLAQEWGINCIDDSMIGKTFIDNFDSIIKKYNNNLPIIWIYNEPIACLKTVTGLEFNEFIVRDDWQTIWQEVNQYCLKKISSLGRPVLLIGSVSDVVDCDHANIKVAHPSWQKFLAEKAGMKVVDGPVHVKMDDGGDFFVDRGWGAESVHRYMHEHPDIFPNSSLVDSVWDIFFFWKQLEKSGWFYEVHPNYQGNVAFAEYLKPTVLEFLQDIK
jgi:hypothetical protein